ncbi:MAG: hypothetical protein KDB05_07925 [Planctomycetales bacterium]|nr:hypothetical protein [Planctomycetales bacterium]
MREQRGFCAYSERFIQETDSCDVEHFDPRIKHRAEDGYWNWYAVLHWMNNHKPRKIEPHLPLLTPYSSELKSRIRYDSGQYVVVDDKDREAKNLISYLGWNRPELADDRARHVSRVRELRGFFSNDTEFLAYLHDDPMSKSFATAVEAELGIAIG